MEESENEEQYFMWYQSISYKLSFEKRIHATI